MSTAPTDPGAAEFRAARDLLLELREDLEAARAAFRWPRPEHFNFALDWFDAVAATPERAEQEALVIVEEDGSSQRITYRQMSERSSRVAVWLRKLGVARGDRILVMLDNQVELWETMLAGTKLGAVLLPTTTMLGPRDLQDRVERGQVSWVVVGPGSVGKFAEVDGEFTVIETGPEAASRVTSPAGAHPHAAYEDSRVESACLEILEPTRAEDPLLLYFTSGTTSRAKLVEHSHASYPIGHLSTMYWIGLRPGDVHLNVASPGWGKHAWSNFFAPWIAEATVLVHHYSRFDAAALMAVMERESVTSFCAPPTVWRMLIRADLTRLRTPPREAVSAGEPLDARVITRVQEAWGVEIRDGFGQTETTVQIASTPGMPLKAGALGRPAPGFDVELLDASTGQLITGPGQGEACLRTDPRPVGLMTGYVGDPERTERTLRDGLYRTGDVMRRDEDGLYTYVGRDDDVFKASDYKLSPFELEAVVLEHPEVAEAAVVPSPDPVRLAVPKVYVLPGNDAEAGAGLAESVLAHCRERLAPYARIRRLEFAEALPRTVSGKIRRVELREREQRLHGPDGERTPAPGEAAEYAETDFPGLRRRR